MATLRPLWIIMQQTSRGCVSRNYCCNTLQFEFGNLMLCFLPEAFLRFVDFIEGLDSSIFERSHRTGMTRKLAVELHPTEIIMTLSSDEADELRELVRGAKSVIELADPRHRLWYLNN